MKSVLFAALALFSLAAAPAYAEGEGNGDPFPNRIPGISTLVAPAPARAVTPRLSAASPSHTLHGAGASSAHRSS